MSNDRIIILTDPSVIAIKDGKIVGAICIDRGGNAQLHLPTDEPLDPERNACNIVEGGKCSSPFVDIPITMVGDMIYYSEMLREAKTRLMVELGKQEVRQKQEARQKQSSEEPVSGANNTQT